MLRRGPGSGVAWAAAANPIAEAAVAALNRAASPALRAAAAIAVVKVLIMGVLLRSASTPRAMPKSIR